MKSPFLLLKHFIFITLLFASIESFGEEAAITGKVSDKNNEPLTGAIAELRNAADSTLAKVNVADASGAFLFQNIKEGQYFLKVSFMGFDTYKSEAFTG